MSREVVPQLIVTDFSSIVYLQYVSIGEMTAYRPVHGGFIRQFSEYIDPAMGFAGGINFWFEVRFPLSAFRREQFLTGTVGYDYTS